MKTRAAFAAALLVPTLAVGVSQSTAASAVSAPTYSPAGVQTPQGPTSQWHLPTMTSFKVGSVTRMIRTVAYSTTDGGSGGIRGLRTQYLDVGSSAGWRNVSVNYAGDKLQMANTVSAVDPSTGKLTINAFAGGGVTAAGVPQFIKWSSVDGINWRFRGDFPVKMYSTHTAHDGKNWRAVIPYQGIIVLADHSWVMPFYYQRCLSGTSCASSNSRSTVSLAVSIDQGATWANAAMPFVSATNNYSESSVIQRGDGRLAMVGRYDPDPSKLFLGRLVWRVSDQSVTRAYDLFHLTWTAPRVLIPNRQVVGGLNEGASPKLTRVSGNKLLLAYGRPGSVLAWNYDGSATNWTNVSTLYGLPYPYRNDVLSCDEGAIHAEPKVVDLPCHAMGTSGYLGVTVTDPQRGVTYVSGDTCHVWSCEPQSQPWGDVSWASGTWYQQKVWLIRVHG